MCKLDSIIKHLTTHGRRCTASFLSVNYALISSKYVRINTVCTNCGGGYPICSITPFGLCGLCGSLVLKTSCVREGSVLRWSASALRDNSDLGLFFELLTNSFSCLYLREHTTY